MGDSKLQETKYAWYLYYKSIYKSVGTRKKRLKIGQSLSFTLMK